jgi:propionyl-CoA carboxylase alpha chain
MVHGADRVAAVDRLADALAATEVGGIQTTLPFHRFVAGHRGFRAGEVSTSWVGEHWDGLAAASEAASLARLAAATWAAASDWSPLSGRPTSADGASDDGAGSWADAALEAMVDRWPAT